MAHNARKNRGKVMTWDTEDATYTATLYHGRWSDGLQKTVRLERVGFDGSSDYFAKSFRHKTDARKAHDKALGYMNILFELARDVNMVSGRVMK
jgi:hypothetical protein